MVSKVFAGVFHLIAFVLPIFINCVQKCHGEEWKNISVSIETEINVMNTKMSYKVEPLPNSYALLGEGPHWDVERQSLFFVDILKGFVYRYDYQENKVYKANIENETLASFIIPIEGEPNKFVVGCERHVAVVNWDGVSDTAQVDRYLFSVEQDDAKFAGNRFNDGKADTRGRLYAGTMYEGDEANRRSGSFYKYDKRNNLTVLKGDIGISNGMAWNEKLKKFYYIDSKDLEVKEYDYDAETGDIKNPRVLIDFRGKDGKPDLVPDGMTIDSDGFLYVATYGGSSVLKVNPRTGKIDLEIKLPCEQVTSCAFGGPNLDILYVTTSANGGKPAPAGTTYKITGLGATGLSMTKFRL